MCMLILWSMSHGSLTNPLFSVEAGDTDFVKPSEGSKTISLTIVEVNDNADELVELVSR